MVNTYNTYKNSGIEWIPYIPQSWKTMRLKNVGFLYGGLTGKTGDDFNVEDDNESYMLSFHLQISLITLSLTRISFIR